MRTPFIRLAIAIAFAVAAWLSWSEAKFADRVGDARQQIVTLRYAEVATDLPPGTTLADYLPRQQRLSNEARLVASTVAYWLGRYDDVSAEVDDEDVDADALLIVANAAFRDAQRDAGAGSAAVQQLDGVLNAYASALKASPRHVDAAYNYEFVARYRDQVARAQGKGVKPLTAPAAAMAGDLPAGPTIHGRPGAPPPEAKMEELQMLAPMEYGDREAQPDATPGGKRERKG
ncbi:MAG TPA: hypothetical protein VFZ38_05930 [Vicinamibacterales bacterium]